MNDAANPGRWRPLPLLLTLATVATMVVSTVAPVSTLAGKAGAHKGSQQVAAQGTGKGNARHHQLRGVQAEIVGGKAVSQGHLSFMAVVLVDLHDGTFIQCGGSLIDPSYVLTAAHCVEDDNEDLFPAADFRVLVGKAKISDAGSANQRGVTAVFQNPAWDSDTFANDAAVLRLDAPVSSSIATPIRLVDAGDTEFNNAGRNVVVSGWGRLSEHGSSPNQLRQAALKLVSDSSCADAYGSGFFAATMICAAEKGKDACFGDSGGPLIAHEVIGSRRVKKKSKRHKVTVPITSDVQIGIVSWGAGCAEPHFPGVYTRLSNANINAFVTSKIT